MFFFTWDEHTNKQTSELFLRYFRSYNPFFQKREQSLSLIMIISFFIDTVLNTVRKLEYHDM